MTSSSRQHWLDRNRPPRVQITYDVETGGAIQKKEIPFVVGVMSDLSGHNAPTSKLKERKFVQIDGDSFDRVLSDIAPKLKFSVSNQIAGDGSKLKVELDFKFIEDFRPEQVAKNVPVLARILEKRRFLNDLIAKLEGNDEGNSELIKLIGDKTRFSAAVEELKADEEPRASNGDHEEETA